MLWRKMISGMAAFGAVVLFVVGAPMARTITVDDDGPADSSIRDAVEAASEGDTVLVKPGIYTVTRILGGRGIEMKDGLVLQGAGADSTFIKADPLAPPAYLIVFTGVKAKLDGFTLSCPIGSIVVHGSLWATKIRLAVGVDEALV